MTVRRLISVVDDDESLRLSVSNLLSSVGLASAVFESAEDFMASSLRQQTGCLVLDLRLQGSSGFDLMTNLRAAGQTIPTIVLTGHGDEPVRQQALALGALAFLTKPFRPRELLAVVRQALAEDRPTNEG